jgi:Protein of unknown function (DUF3515)
MGSSPRVLRVNDETRDGPPRGLLIAAVVLAIGTIVGILVFAALRQSPVTLPPVPIVGVPAPKAESADCRTLTDSLPDRLGDYHRAQAADPAPAGAAAWRPADDGDPVILRCGVERPDEFVVGVPVQVVDEVQWFRVGEAGAGKDGVGEAGAGDDDGRSTWYAVDRAAYIALTLPQGAGPTPIQEISDLIAKTLPAKPVDPAPVG